MIRKLFLRPAEIILILFAAYVILFRNISSPWERAIDSDGKGYYAYLTATFIYHDYHYGFVNDYESKYYPPDGTRYFDFRNDTEDGGKVNQYFPGVAILWLPFFLLAHFLSYLFGFPTDGYSIIYQWSIMAASLFYLWLGMKVLYSLLKRFTTPGSASFILFLLAFGTGIFCYTIYAPAFTHTPSFALITIFLAVCFKMFTEYRRRYVLWAVLLFCLISITRPTNAVVILLVPFAAGSFPVLKSFFIGLSRNKPAIIYSLCIAAIVFAIPVMLWHAQTGHYIVYSYGPHKFYFSDPQFLNNLFSYRKGLFLYTPLAFIGMFGLIPLYRQNKWQLIFLALFLFTAAYLISSWSWWWYGFSLGQRSYIDYYAVLGILLCLLWNVISRSIIAKIVFISAVLFLIYLNIVQTYQHIYGINPGDNITKEIYWNNFLRLKRQEAATAPIDETKMMRTAMFYNNFDPDKWSTDSIPSEPGKGVTGVDGNKIYGGGFVQKIKPLVTDTGMALRIRAVIQGSGIEKTVLVASFQSGDKAYDYHSWNVGKYLDGSNWVTVEFMTPVPMPQAENDELKVYLWNGDTKEELSIDALTLEFFSPRK